MARRTCIAGTRGSSANCVKVLAVMAVGGIVQNDSSSQDEVELTFQKLVRELEIKTRHPATNKVTDQSTPVKSISELASNLFFPLNGRLSRDPTPEALTMAQAMDGEEETLSPELSPKMITKPSSMGDSPISSHVFEAYDEVAKELDCQQRSKELQAEPQRRPPSLRLATASEKKLYSSLPEDLFQPLNQSPPIAPPRHKRLNELSPKSPEPFSLKSSNLNSNEDTQISGKNDSQILTLEKTLGFCGSGSMELSGPNAPSFFTDLEASKEETPLRPSRSESSLLNDCNSPLKFADRPWETAESIETKILDKGRFVKHVDQKSRQSPRYVSSVSQMNLNVESASDSQTEKSDSFRRLPKQELRSREHNAKALIRRATDAAERETKYKKDRVALSRRSSFHDAQSAEASDHEPRRSRASDHKTRSRRGSAHDTESTQASDHEPRRSRASDQKPRSRRTSITETRNLHTRSRRGSIHETESATRSRRPSEHITRSRHDEPKRSGLHRSNSRAFIPDSESDIELGAEASISEADLRLALKQLKLNRSRDVAAVDEAGSLKLSLLVIPDEQPKKRLSPREEPSREKRSRSRRSSTVTDRITSRKDRDRSLTLESQPSPLTHLRPARLMEALENGVDVIVSRHPRLTMPDLEKRRWVRSQALQYSTRFHQPKSVDPTSATLSMDLIGELAETMKDTQCIDWLTDDARQKSRLTSMSSMVTKGNNDVIVVYPGERESGAYETVVNALQLRIHPVSLEILYNAYFDNDEVREIIDEYYEPELEAPLQCNSYDQSPIYLTPLGLPEPDITQLVKFARIFTDNALICVRPDERGNLHRLEFGAGYRKHTSVGVILMEAHRPGSRAVNLFPGGWPRVEYRDVNSSDFMEMLSDKWDEIFEA